jgi:type I restriction enzyme M protein
MALKKSELYSSLWQSCDALRGGMDASQYKDYVLVLLFIKYVSDKYAGKPFQPLTIPPGAGFADMAALKGKSDIGDQINKKIIAPLVAANAQLSLSDFPDFNDAAKLGTGKEMVDRLTDLVAIFENKALDFSKNRADGDDILGDAYEYLMQHFATESGKSKGQFYTPAEVSRVIAAVLGIASASTTPQTTVYDPTCGSGSLLLKVADAAPTKVALYGQEKDAATSGLARMNMILHDQPTAEIKQGNTLADPKFRDGKAGNESLKVFDYVVANPPFSDKRWSTGIDPLHDPWQRFEGFGVPPAKQGDYAYLLHIVRSLKSTGRAACILPHGVLFRGNAEADIRRALIRKGYIEAIIGLPVNLFYGTGIPACIVVIDKSRAAERVAAGTGIFMIDASQAFMKDGPKNRLRERDIHRIVDTFQRRQAAPLVPRYARQVSLADIEKNEHNLNLPRYIDSQLPEDRQDIDGHLRGGIPEADVTAADSLVSPLSRFWAVCPQLERALFKPNRPGYVDLAVDKAAIKSTIHSHPEFAGFITRMNAHFAAWRDVQAQALKALRPQTPEAQPRRVIAELSESLLAHYLGQPLIDAYAVYQHLMDYWAQTMQDDCYAIATDGWKAQTYRVIETDKKGKQKDKGWACDLVPKPLIVARYFAQEQAALQALQAELEGTSAKLAELEEEHGGEDAAFAGFDKINVAAVKERLHEIEGELKAEIKAARGGKSGKALAADGGEAEEPVAEELRVLLEWMKLAAEESALKKRVKEADAALDAAAYAKYPKLIETEVQALVVNDKWLAALDAAVHGEMDRLSQQLTARVKELAERYEAPLPKLNERVAELEARVNRHLERMGFAWR